MFDKRLKLSPISTVEDDPFTVGTDGPYTRERLSHRLLGNIKNSLAGILKRPADVRFVLVDDGDVGELIGRITPEHISFRVCPPGKK